MFFEEGYIYHIYNQGNNRQKIFFKQENYFYFLQKIRKYILPYADILAWCLMPNHFHLMVLVNKIDINIVSKETGENISRSFNDSIGIMLRSYTNAINKQQKRTGKLFREKTKAECINCPKGLIPSFITANGTTYFTAKITERQYPQVCFNYIHQNPVKAGLVKNAERWEFSSAKDYAGLRHGSLINKDTAKKYVDIKL